MKERYAHASFAASGSSERDHSPARDDRLAVGRAV